MDGLSADAAAGRTSGGLNKDDERIARAYLRLCEDELELRREGWISNATWRIWHDGMKTQLEKRPFCAAWSRIEREAEQQGIPAGKREYQLLRAFKQGQTNPRATVPRPKLIALALRFAP